MESDNLFKQVMANEMLLERSFLSVETTIYVPNILTVSQDTLATILKGNGQRLGKFSREERFDYSRHSFDHIVYYN